MSLASSPALLHRMRKLVGVVHSDQHSHALWQVIYFPSRPGYTDPHVKRRVLDYLLFMNSKASNLPASFAQLKRNGRNCLTMRAELLRIT